MLMKCALKYAHFIRDLCPSIDYGSNSIYIYTFTHLMPRCKQYFRTYAKQVRPFYVMIKNYMYLNFCEKYCRIYKNAIYIFILSCRYVSSHIL